MGKYRLSVTVVLVVLITLGLGQFGWSADNKVLKVGITSPFTGHSAIWGRDTKTSVETAFKAIDYKIGDYKIEVVWIDSQSDPAKATNAFSEAVEQKGIDVAFYDVHSSVSIALMDVVANYKIPLFFPLGAADTINQKWRSDPEKYSYFGGKGWPDPGKLAPGYVEALEAAIKKGLWNPENRIVAIYGEETDWGRSFCSRLKSAFEEAGWKIQSEDYIPNTQTDHYPLLSKYKKANVSVVAGTITGTASMTGFIKQASEVGLKSVIVADGLGWSGNWYDMTGESSNFVLDMIPQLTTPEARQWAEEINQEYGFLPSPSSGGLVYDYVRFFIKVANRVLEKHGNLDRASFYDILITEVNTGKLTFSKKDGAIIMQEYKFTSETMPDPVVGPQYYYFPVIQYYKGKGSIVYPDQWKEKDIQFRK